MGRYARTMMSIALTLTCIYLVGLLRSLFLDIWGVLSSLFYTFLASLIITYILQPAVDVLHRRRVPRSAAILIVYAVIAAILAVVVLNLIPVISRQIAQLSSSLPAITAEVSRWIDMVNSRKTYLPNAVRTGIENALNQLEHRVEVAPTGLFSVVTSTLNAIFMAFVVPFLVFYMLKDAKAIGRGMVRMAPAKSKHRVRLVLRAIDDTLGGYVRGQFLIMLAVGLLSFIGYLIIRLPYALLLGAFLGFADIIPYLGPIIGIAPAVIIALTTSGWPMLVKVVIVNIAVQQIEGNILSPQIMGRTLHLHPMAIVAALIVGGEAGGVLGLILAVPALAVCKVVWTQWREARSHGAYKV
ncbi:AI-2E family transporter [Alicyclobacillus mali (ex Roth et al. 2021)]|uniref:AI-2E family transporter n=1 Tax=Alicyclobacillus mali (ex Roth et al. 2021) TaxID=1123961 RepID=UPI001F5D008D|nr:AI-2E family transporter [Alicyclobacillus mali (ex Roth et al. 2021)]